MIVLLDTNVVLDVLLHREPFYGDSAKVWGMAERGHFRGMISAVTLTTVYYVVRRQASRKQALAVLGTVRACVGFAPCDAAVLERAIDSEFPDFEDAVQYFSALAARASVLVTRDLDHFPGTDLNVLTPAAFLASQAPE